MNPATSPDAANMASIIRTAEVILTCGAGGVGKTTVAAAIARAAASDGRRVALVTVDPAQRLADAMGIDLGDDLTEIDIDGPGRLFASMIDTSAAWDRLIVNRAPNPDIAQRLLVNPIYRNITARFIQSHEYIAIERLHELRNHPDVDLLVVDTPPSGHAADLLDAPERMVDFFNGNLLNWLTMPTRNRFAAVASKPFFAAVDLLLGKAFVSDLSQFFGVLRELGPGFTERAQQVEATLHEEATNFVIVTSPSPRPCREAVAFGEQLVQRKLAATAIVFNRVLPRWLDDDAVATQADALRLAADGVAAQSPLVEPRHLVAAADRADELHRVAVAERQRLDGLPVDGLVVELPLIVDRAELEMVDELAAVLMGNTR